MRAYRARLEHKSTGGTRARLLRAEAREGPVELCGTVAQYPLEGYRLPSLMEALFMATPARKRRPQPKVEPLSNDEAQKLLKHVQDAIYNFKGPFDELESALGMLMMGPLVGWKVLVLIHNKRTIRKYEEILGIKVREAFPEEGPYTYKSLGYEWVQKIQNFWKAVSGEVQVEGRRELSQ